MFEFGQGIKERFDFLGFEFHWGKSRKKKPLVKKRTSRPKFRKSLASLSDWLKENRCTRIRVLMDSLNVKLKGYYNYYGVIGNFES